MNIISSYYRKVGFFVPLPGNLQECIYINTFAVAMGYNNFLTHPYKGLYQKHRNFLGFSGTIDQITQLILEIKAFG